MQYYSFDKQYGDLFAGAGIPLKKLLHKSGMPEELFDGGPIMLTKEQTYLIVEEAGKLVPDDSTVVRIATWENIERFSPPVFASYCSKNAITCIERLARYKRIVCPLIFTPCIKDDEFHIEIRGIDAHDELPVFWTEIEAAFIINIIRNATKEHIVPLYIEMRHEVTNRQLIAFWDCPVLKGERNAIVLRLTDAKKQFISENEEMWLCMEPELKRQLSELQTGNTIITRVRNTLIKMLPSGNCKIEDVASQLCFSKRSLQRILAKENTTFQYELSDLRKTLALHYIKDNKLENNDIAFLLGYQDTNALLRAFRKWTGKTIGSYRREAKNKTT